MSNTKTGNRKLGRDKVKCARYTASHRREKAKVKKVLKSSGKKAALLYADTHQVKPYLMTLLAKMPEPPT